MFGELMNIPTDTLIDMVCVILAGGIATHRKRRGRNRADPARVATSIRSRPFNSIDELKNCDG